MRLNDTDRQVIRLLLKGSPDQATLATTLGVPRPYITKSIQRLRGEGLVELAADTDGRKRRPCLTVCSEVRKLEEAVKSLTLAVMA
jgi:DNA-binding MarR family transcriptional regulator